MRLSIRIPDLFGDETNLLDLFLNFRHSSSRFHRLFSHLCLLLYILKSSAGITLTFFRFGNVFDILVLRTDKSFGCALLTSEQVLRLREINRIYRAYKRIESYAQKGNFHSDSIQLKLINISLTLFVLVLFDTGTCIEESPFSANFHNFCGLHLIPECYKTIFSPTKHTLRKKKMKKLFWFLSFDRMYFFLNERFGNNLFLLILIYVSQYGFIEKRFIGDLSCLSETNPSQPQRSMNILLQLQKYRKFSKEFDIRL